MDKPLSTFARLVLLGAGGLAVVAGPVLYFFPDDTARYFAWTIQHPLTPVFMGAAYFAGIGNLLAVREDRWSLARVQLPAIIVFSSLMLIATLLHIPIFDWSHPVAWAWLVVYVISPMAATIVFFQMERGFNPPQFESRQMPRGFSTLIIIAGGIQALIGAALFLFPEHVSPLWAWSLTPLTSRVIGGWWLSGAALQLMLARQETLHTAYVGLLANLLINSLLVAGALLHFGELNGPPASIAFYFSFCLALVGISAFSWFRAGK
ncbi:MAG TPA: hypothetical protein VK900_13330 [Anaerolineales bacterium]|nr:hypothetical protein [Anaerolineales bacterium]